MLNSRRKFCVSVLVSSIAAATNSSFAEEFIPPGTVKIIVPFVPGGTADVLARTISVRLAKRYNQSVVVENKPGMGGNIGASETANAKPDGSILLLGTIGIHATSSVYPKLSYSPDQDLQPIIVIGGVPCVIAVHPSRPFNNLQELVIYAKKNPGVLNFGSAGAGSSTHMVGELFQQAAGIKLTHIPYKGSAASMNDLMGGQIDMMFELITTAGPIVQSGRIRGLAVTSKNRNQVLPDIPTVSEVMIPGFEATGWFTVATSSKVPKATVDQYNLDINDILKAPDLQDTWKSLALNVMGGTPSDAKKFFISESIKWKKVIQSGGIKAE
jgi:tripartite-type tricarboxylate transporter receptor subunit TctC